VGEDLAGRDARLDERQKVLRTIVSRAVGGEQRLFKDSCFSAVPPEIQRKSSAAASACSPDLALVATSVSGYEQGIWHVNRILSH
jgi:hypothetical protein